MVGKILFPSVGPGSPEGTILKMHCFGDGIPLPVSLIYGWVLCGQIVNVSGNFWALPTAL